jgi:hypothetical protein
MALAPSRTLKIAVVEAAGAEVVVLLAEVLEVPLTLELVATALLVVLTLCEAVVVPARSADVELCTAEADDVSVHGPLALHLD